ncbi:MAG: hypothetical protein ACUVS2_11630 [Candidatus Flexifilum sp.]|jgi:hypothetical protein
MMGFRVEWLYRDRVIFEQLYGDVTVGEIEAVAEALQTLAEAGQAPVHIINDVRSLRKYPINLKSIRQAVQVPASSNLGWLVVIQNDNPLVRFIAATIAQLVITDLRMSSVKTPEEALRFLLSRDPSLDEALLASVMPDAPST